MDMHEILKQAGPQEVMISGWGRDPITVKLRRPSLTEMIVGDYIPNPLLTTVSKLFRASPEELTKVGEAEQARALHCIASRALVEPSMAELQAADVSLTDDQYMQIYAFVLGGAEVLDRFRRAFSSGAGKHVSDHEHEGERTDGDQ